MKRLVYCICFFLASNYVSAFDFDEGTYYFDNSKIHYSNIHFAAFDTVASTVRVYDLELDDESSCWWELTLEEPVSCDLYSFVESSELYSFYNETVDQFIDNHTIRHTQLGMWKEMNPLTHPNYPGYVYCPILNGDVSDGYWRTQQSYNATASCSLPVIHINTQDSLPIVSKDHYISGTLWLDNCGIEGYESIGSEEAPLPIDIKGRGNYTWRAFYKKPYKIKLAEKQSPLGLDNSKHFILMPHADDLSGYLRDETGFEMSRQLGMDYTPRQLPVEVVLNGEYIGLYFLCEKIRVEKGRVAITEQQDNETDPELVSGGWLLELSGSGNKVYGQFENNDPAGIWYWFESHSPENFSKVQVDYISRLISKTDSCIFVTDKTDRGWENYIDIYSLSRFYVINEVMSNIEAFCRSMFLYKDRGEDVKMKYGPVWDFGNSFTLAGTNEFIYNYETKYTFLWLRELLKFPRFRAAVITVWRKFKNENVLSKVFEHDSQWMSAIETAKQYDKIRWPYYGDMSTNASTNYLNRVSSKVEWLDAQWSVPQGDVNCDGHVNAVDVTIIYNYLLNGDESDMSTCDVNCDGAINGADVTVIYNILLDN